MYKILTINPGSTSTKIAFFRDNDKILEKTYQHSTEELSAFNRIIDQSEFRWKFIGDFLQEINEVPDAVVGRGGVLKPLPGGVWKVNLKMEDDIIQGNVQQSTPQILVPSLPGRSARNLISLLLLSTLYQQMNLTILQELQVFLTSKEKAKHMPSM